MPGHIYSSTLHEKLYKKIGQHFYRIRRQRDEKIATVAHATGIHTATISRIENGAYPGLTG